MRKIKFSVYLILFILLIFFGTMTGKAWSATSVDLSVSAYTLSPDPVVHNGASTFSVTVTNNDYITTATGLTLAVNLPSNVDFSASPTPSGCSFASGRTILNCSLSTLAAQGTWNVNFTGVGLTPGVQSTDANVSATDNTDPDSNNDSLTKPITVINGADLIITKTGPGGCTTGSCNAGAGATISFNIAVTNNGPDAATTFRVTDNLPAAGDFTYSSATGSGWSCSWVTTTVTCNYSGASIASGASAPAITLTGTLITTAGSITNGASVASTDSSTGDPNMTNNGPSQVIVGVTQTTDLRANKTMVSLATGTTNYALGEAVTLTLSATNQGPRNATGVTVTDIVPTGFGIGTLPAGCLLSGRTVTCTATGTLNSGATSSSFVVPLTAPGSSGSGTNIATPGRTTPSAGANTPASVNYTVAAATANLQAHKTMVSVANGTTTFAYSEAVRLTLSVTNNGPQNADGVTVTDDVPAGFVIGILPANCANPSGNTVVCAVTGTLNNGATSSNFVIPLTAPGSSGSGTNTATPGRATPTEGVNTPASTSYSVAAPYANLRTNKTMVSAAPGSTNGTTTYVAGMSVTLTLSATNLGLHDATGVTITDTVSADFSVNSLPGGCSGGTGPGPINITCTVGALSNGATSANFVIPLTVLVTATAGSNTACVGHTDPSGGTNTCSSAVNYTIIDPYAHLTLTKSKTPSPLVANGANITNTITVTNSGSSSSPATGTVTVVDTLTSYPNETYISVAAPWACVDTTATDQKLTCTYAISGSLARNVSLPNLVITTTSAPLNQGNISNTACTGLSAGSAHLPTDNGSSCATATVFGSNRHVNLSITKTSSPAPSDHVTATTDHYHYTLVVSNASADAAPTVNISDTLPAWVSGSTTGTAVITATVAAGESCTFGHTVNCTLKNLTSGSPRTITITVYRRVLPGTRTNTATATTPDSIDTTGPKFATADIIIDPVADVLISDIAGAPNPVKVGVQLTYTTSIHNNGPDTADGVVLRHRINLASWLSGSRRMSFVTGSAAISGTTATCNFVTFGAGHYVGDEGVECTGFNLAEGESRQLVFKVIPVYSYPDGVPSTFTSEAYITTTTGESDAPDYTNNKKTNTVAIDTQVIDLTVTNNDPGYDPTAFGDFIIYKILVQNNGPSQATGFMLTVTPTPPVQGTAALPYTMTYNNTGSTMPSGASCSQATPAADVICYMAGSRAASIMAPSTSQTFNLKFDTGPLGNNPSGSKTYKTTAVVSSYETGSTPFSGDRLPANNTVAETTTVLPKTDLAIITKAVSGSGTFSINEPFTYTIVAANYGPSAASGVQVSDTLPSGLAVNGTITAALGSGSLVLKNCSSSGTPVTVTCDLGVLPVASGPSNLPNLLTISIPVRAPYGTYTASNGFNTNRPNYATIAPLPNTSIDKIPGNNTSNTVNVQIVKSSISGTVYRDMNNNGVKSGAEETGIPSVQVRMQGTDAYNNTIDINTITDGDGNYLFDNLPPSNNTGFTLTETQPPIYYFDGKDTRGTGCGTSFCGTAPTIDNDTISGIRLAANSTAVSYLFGEIPAASIAGYVWFDRNNDGIRDAGETIGIPNVHIRLTGTATIGGAAVNVTTLTGVDGSYSFGPLRAGTYTITETQPAWVDGLDRAGSAGGTAGNDIITGIILITNTIATEYNFGELGGSLAGTVYNDLDNDGIHEAAEPGIPNVQVRLTGIDYNGNAVNQVTTTAGDGSYSFANLPVPNAVGYTIRETQPTGWTDGKDTLGTLGGTLGDDVFSRIYFPTPGASGTGYNFGERQGTAIARVAGMVWLDNDHEKTFSTGDIAQAGWAVELIQRADPMNNTNYMLIATTTTNASGEYAIEGVSPGTYEIRFRHPSSGYVYGIPVSVWPAVDLTYGTIRNLVLANDDNAKDQNLPLDPEGVIYNSVTRQPVAGATVTISGPAAFNPALHLVGGLPNVSKITDATGRYQFLLYNTDEHQAPVGQYRLTITPPAGYLPGPSVLIPSCTNVLAVGDSPNPLLIQASDSAPSTGTPLHAPASCPAISGGFGAGAVSTLYYLSFNLTPRTSANIVNNHIPIDPVLNGAIIVTKTTPLVNVKRGDLVPYTITMTNTMSATLSNIDARDTIPPGFKYRLGSGTLNGVRKEPLVAGRQLTWRNLTFKAGEKKTFLMILVVGSGVSEGEYTNQVYAANNIINTAVSNIATATVRVIPDPTFDCPDVIGKVFDDKNANGYQDEGELGIANVRLATARGILITTDAEGRFHIPCPEIPNENRGSNFILKLDDRTLPSGYRITTENPRVVRLTRGKMTKMNFGATVHRVIRIDVNDAAFEKEGVKLLAQWQQRIAGFETQLREKPSVVRIAYRQGTEPKSLVDKRIGTIRDMLQALWKKGKDCPPLVFEEEIVEVR